MFGADVKVLYENWLTVSCESVAHGRRAFVAGRCGQAVLGDAGRTWRAFSHQVRLRGLTHGGGLRGQRPWWCGFNRLILLNRGRHQLAELAPAEMGLNPSGQTVAWL